MKTDHERKGNFWVLIVIIVLVDLAFLGFGSFNKHKHNSAEQIRHSLVTPQERNAFLG